MHWIETTTGNVAQIVAQNPLVAGAIVAALAFFGWRSIRHRSEDQDPAEQVEAPGQIGR